MRSQGWSCHHWIQRGIIELVPVFIYLQVLLQTTATYLDLYGIAGGYDCVDRAKDCEIYIAGSSDAFNQMSVSEIQNTCTARDYLKDQCKLSCGCPGCDKDGRNCKSQSNDYLGSGYDQIFTLEGRRREENSWDHQYYGYSLYGNDTSPTAKIILTALLTVIVFCIAVQAFLMRSFKRRNEKTDLEDFDLALCFDLNKSYRGWFTYISKAVIILFTLGVWIYLCSQEVDIWIPIEATYIQIALVCYSVSSVWKPTDVDVGFDRLVEVERLLKGEKPKGCLDGLTAQCKPGGWFWCAASRSSARVSNASMEVLYQDSSAECEMQKMERYCTSEA